MRHGPFTEHLLDGLYGAADADGNGGVTMREGKLHLDRTMTWAARSPGREALLRMVSAEPGQEPEGPPTVPSDRRTHNANPNQRSRLPCDTDTRPMNPNLLLR